MPFPTGNLLAYWKNDQYESFDGGVIEDKTGHGHDLSPGGTTDPDIQVGKLGNCTVTDTSTPIDGWLSCPDGFDFTATGGYTVHMWIMVPTTDLYVGFQSNTTVGGNVLRLNDDGTVSAWHYNPVTTWTEARSTGTLTANTWHRVAAIWNQNTEELSIVLDNDIDSTSGVTAWQGNPGSGSNFTLHKEDGGASGIDIAIDEVGVWDTPLNSTQLSYLWNSGNGVTYTETYDQTQTGKAAIKKTVDRTQAGTSRVKVSTTRTQAGKGRVTATTTRTQTSTSRITVRQPRNQLGKSAVKNTTNRVQTGVADVKNTTLRTQPGVGRIKTTVLKLQTSTSRITVQQPKNQSGKAAVRNAVPRTQTGVTRIRKQFTVVQTGKGAVKKALDRTQPGTSRIKFQTPRTQEGTARIFVPGVGSQTQQGKAAIFRITSRTQTGITRVRVQQPRVQLGKASVIPNTKTVTKNGMFLVKKIGGVLKDGRTTVKAATSKTQAGKAFINFVTRNTTKPGKAMIVGGTGRVINQGMFKVLGNLVRQGTSQIHRNNGVTINKNGRSFIVKQASTGEGSPDGTTVKGKISLSKYQSETSVTAPDGTTFVT